MSQYIVRQNKLPPRFGDAKLFHIKSGKRLRYAYEFEGLSGQIIIVPDKMLTIAQVMNVGETLFTSLNESFKDPNLPEGIEPWESNGWRCVNITDHPLEVTKLGNYGLEFDNTTWTFFKARGIVIKVKGLHPRQLTMDMLVQFYKSFNYQKLLSNE